MYVSNGDGMGLLLIYCCIACWIFLIVSFSLSRRYQGHLVELYQKGGVLSYF